MSGDGWDEDDPTIAARSPALDELTQSGEITPIEVPTCPECHAAAVHDDFDKPSLASFPNEDFCVLGRKLTWWWCRKSRKLVQIWP